MIGLLQRVREASVDVDGETIAAIDRGLVVLVGVEQGDGPAQADRLAQRILQYRVFADEQGRMNLDVRQVGGAVLAVPQFTLAADTRQGNRPGFSKAADSETGKQLFDHLVAAMRRAGQVVVTGCFGANMQVRLCNDGPVTFSLQVQPDD